MSEEIVVGRVGAHSPGMRVVEALRCASCRHWQPLDPRWGVCGNEQVSRAVGPEPPLVTRGTHGCRRWAPRPLRLRAAAVAEGAGDGD